MVFLAPPVARADTDAASAPVAGRACGADSMYARVPVYVRVTVANPADTAAGSSLLLIAEAVATRIRAALSGSADSLPRGDTLSYYARREGDSVWAGGLDSAGVHVVARRNGTVRWSFIRDQESPAAVVLEQALAAAEEAEEFFVPHEAYTADSIPFTLNYARGFQMVNGRVVAREVAPPTLAAFTTRMAAEKQAATVPGTLRAPYPDAARVGLANAAVTLQFVVDTTGRADMTTVRDLWPVGRPRLTGELGDYYDAFVRSATGGVRQARFHPAEIAGCRVRQLVQLPFTFTITR